MAIDTLPERSSFVRFVFALDEKLRRRLSVVDYVDHQDCILRMQIGQADEEVTLADDLHLRAGDRLIDLHLWNEHLPEMGRGGPSVGWAHKLSKLLDFSLRELAAYLAARPQLDDIVVIRAIMPLRGLEQSRHLHFIATRYGFHSIQDDGPRSFGGRLHRAGENALGLMLVLASNPAVAHLGILVRSRAPLYLARRDLNARYRKSISELKR